jgi:hypothetical protein
MGFVRMETIMTEEVNQEARRPEAYIIDGLPTTPGR